MAVVQEYHCSHCGDNDHSIAICKLLHVEFANKTKKKTTKKSNKEITTSKANEHNSPSNIKI